VSGSGVATIVMSDRLLEREDMRSALRDRDFGAVFRLMSRYQGATQSQIAAAIGQPQGRVNQIMTKPHKRITSMHAIERIADGLKIPGHLVGLADRPWEKEDVEPDNQEVDPMLRRGVLKIGGAALVGGVLDALDHEPEAMKTILDATSVTEDRLLYYERTAKTLGVEVVRVAPTEVLNTAVGHFRSVRRLVKERQRTAHRVRLVRVSARLATIVGEVLFNEGKFDLARHWYTTGYHAALDVGDRYLADTALAGQAYLATYSDDPLGVLRIVGPRLEGRHSLTPPVAWLWSFKAKAHAARGEKSETAAAFDQAHRALAGSAAEQVTPGIFSFVPEKLSLYEASAYVALHDPQRAARAAADALEQYDLTETTEPALVRFERASALVQAGEVEEACRYAVATVLDPRTYPSITVKTRAHKFDGLFGAQPIPAVAQWRDIMTARYGAVPPLSRRPLPGVR
jgi:hypothetical protein